MYPVLFHVGSAGVGTHEVALLLGVGLALLMLRHQLRARAVTDRRLWTIAGGALLGGAIVAKLGTAWQYLRDAPEPSLLGLWVYGGKTVLGGLAGAYAGALITKRIVGYRAHTGDLLTPAVIVGIAVGRIGCFLAEPPGTPTSMPWGITLDQATIDRIPGCERCVAGVPLHPTFLYEIAFLAVLFVVLWYVRPRIGVEGETFKIFLLAYGLFRFAVEFIRVNPRFAWGLSGSQVFLIFTLPVLIAYFARQVARGAYHVRGRLPLSIGRT